MAIHPTPATEPTPGFTSGSSDRSRDALTVGPLVAGVGTWVCRNGLSRWRSLDKYGEECDRLPND